MGRGFWILSNKKKKEKLVALLAETAQAKNIFHLKLHRFFSRIEIRHVVLCLGGMFWES